MRTRETTAVCRANTHLFLQQTGNGPWSIARVSDRSYDVQDKSFPTGAQLQQVFFRVQQCTRCFVDSTRPCDVTSPLIGI